MKNVFEKNVSAIVKEKLFCRGFFITTSDNKIDFFDNEIWERHKINNLFFYVHKDSHFYYAVNDETSIFLIGHCYNPFIMEHDENKILEGLSKFKTINEILNKINGLTGLFTIVIILNDSIYIVGDCCCMQAAYYGIINGQFVVSSHAQLIGDCFNLKQTKYVLKLKKYRYWKRYGLFLPGDSSQFDSVKRLVPNTYVSFHNDKTNIVRFFPNKELESVNTDKEYKNTIEKIGNILHNNLELITKKWERPAISMTGGMDSKTTLACANGLYDKFKYYSYISMEGDKIDAVAAKKIANAIGVKHNTFEISENDADFSNVEDLRFIIEHNYGDIGVVNENDVRKRSYFLDTKEFDVEVKSWVSEIGRANYYKKFGVKKMPKKLSPRAMTTMYKFFFYNRIEALKTDRLFKKYIKDTKFNNIYNYDASDMYLWEFRYGAWGGLVITSEHRVSYDITIPYNNRILMNEFLKLPLEKRIKDILHEDIIKLMNEKIYGTGITITNYNKTKERMYLEKIYWYINRLIF